MLKCDNCDRQYEREDQLQYVFPDIPNLLHRLDPGGTVPAGECPECGALVYLEQQENQQHELQRRPGATATGL